MKNQGYNRLLEQTPGVLSSYLVKLSKELVFNY